MEKVSTLNEDFEDDLFDDDDEMRGQKTYRNGFQSLVSLKELD